MELNEIILLVLFLNFYYCQSPPSKSDGDDPPNCDPGGPGNNGKREV